MKVSLADLRGTASPGVSQFLEIQKDLWEHAIICKPVQSLHRHRLLYHFSLWATSSLP